MLLGKKWVFILKKKKNRIFSLEKKKNQILSLEKKKKTQFRLYVHFGILKQVERAHKNELI
ncbi:hypothetical protein Syun_014019 [Stephania yunnanensis]|uniref:Uncharacterized protein n=1 Tax=Stephania yunnanensis TaxID=152371 RepID=A0AAP0JIY5_9MAGN